MVKLRSLSNKELSQLEADLELIKVGIHVLGVNYVAGKWYAHFLVQDARTQDTKDFLEPKFEKTIETKELKK